MPATEVIGYVTASGPGVAEELGTIAMLAGEPVGCGLGSTPQTATGTAAGAPGEGAGGRIIRLTVTAGGGRVGRQPHEPDRDDAGREGQCRGEHGGLQVVHRVNGLLKRPQIGIAKIKSAFSSRE